MKLASLIALFLMLANCGPKQPPSQLIAGLESMTADDAGRELDRRLAERFASGISEAKLVGELTAEGFQVGERMPFCGGPRCASVERWPDRLGGLAWSVHWTADQDGKVTSVRSGVALVN